MKREFLVVLLIAAVFAFVYIFSDTPPTQAKVEGICVHCHTMHNSQNGSPMRFDGSSTPNPALTRGSCAGCHSDTGTATIKTIDIQNFPIVWNTGGGTQDPGTSQSWSGSTYNLAGGNFYYVTTIDAKGHNVEGVANQDATLLNSPPGWDATYDESTVDYDSNNRLTCAGSNGCHGNRDKTGNLAGIKGGHHGDDTCLKFGTIDEGKQGTDVATSYRFLYKVKGGEDADWQATFGVNDHNEYKGQIFAARANQNWTTIDTISELCAECHGVFHMSSGIGTASPWLRHPTDAILPATGEYQYYNGAGNPYSLEAPVARTTIPNSPGETVAPGDIVMCLSCHRAHASEYAHSFGGAADTAGDILRWDYDTMVAGGTSADTGCFTCHTEKNVAP